MSRTDTRQQILDIAETLFQTRGYTSVRLRDIATAVSIKHAALYYHFPGGKEDIYVEVMARSFQRHQQGMAAAINEAGPDLAAQLRAAANWLLSQPPVNIARMEQSDFPAIGPSAAESLSLLLYNALRQPLRTALHHNASRLGITDLDLAAISFVSLVESIHSSNNPYLSSQKEAIIDGLIEMLLQGWLKR